MQRLRSRQDYNDRESVRRLMEENSGEVACIVVEPVAANMGVVPPEDGFLEFLRDIADENGSLLIFDEVITGFRLGLDGAQGYYGVHYDLSHLWENSRRRHAAGCLWRAQGCYVLRCTLRQCISGGHIIRIRLR